MVGWVGGAGDVIPPTSRKGGEKWGTPVNTRHLQGRDDRVGMTRQWVAAGFRISAKG